jgi:ATP-dependent Clp protease protease subunit
MIDIIEASRIPIVTVAMGVAMSAGFMLFLSGHKRYAFKHSNLMVHEGSAAFSGTAEQIEQAQKNYKKQIDGMKEYILSRTNIPEKVFNKNKTKDWYLTADELIKYSVADKLVSSFDDILN